MQQFGLYQTVEDRILKGIIDRNTDGNYFNTVEDSKFIIILLYFSFTTLSTVGFGDFHPKSNVERIFITFQMLIGVGLFSYFLGGFIEIIQRMLMPPGDGDEDGLSRFFGLINYFNGKEDLDPDLKSKIEEYFDYRWSHDKNMTQDPELHQNIFREMTEQNKDQLRKKFLFRDFMKRFQFNIPRNNIHFKHPHSRYVWGDPIYKSFMIQIMENLEPYQFMKDEILVKEVEEVSCLYFIQTSQFAVGYTVNGE